MVLKLYLLVTSLTGTTAACCFKMEMIRGSVNLIVFIIALFKVVIFLYLL